MCTLSVSNVIYHKFSHGAAFYTLNGKNANVMLALRIIICLGKSEVSAARVSVCGITEKLAEYAYTVCNAPEQMMPYIFNHSSCEFILTV